MKLAAPGNDCDAGLVNFAQKFPSSLGASAQHNQGKDQARGLGSSREYP